MRASLLTRSLFLAIIVSVIASLVLIFCGLVVFYYPNSSASGVADTNYRSHSKNADVKLAGQNIYILSIDGGGVFGIIPTKVLIRLETEIQSCLPKEAAVGEPWKQFHVISGTSTGAIIAAGLVTPTLNGGSARASTPDQLYKLYMNHATEMFKSNLWPEPNWFQKVGNAFLVLFLGRPLFNSDAIRAELGNVLGKVESRDALTDFVIPFYLPSEHTFAYANRLGINILNNWFGNQSLLQANTISMVDLAMNSLSAPGYFAPHQERIQVSGVEGLKGKRPYAMQFLSIDGGLFQANPVFLGISEARERFGANSQLHILSLGTGRNVKRADFPMNGHGTYDTPSVAQLLLKISTLFLETPSLVSDYFLMRDPTVSYTRIDGGIPTGVSLDMSDAGKFHLGQIDLLADDIVKNSKDEIKHFAQEMCGAQTLH